MWYNWLIFGIMFIFMPLFVANFRKKLEEKCKPTEEQIKHSRLVAFKLILFYWLCDLFFMAFIIKSSACKFIFGVLIMIIVFYNLVNAFLAGDKFSKNMLAKLGLLQDFLIGVGISIYLIYIIGNEDLQQIILAIVAALYGGLFTLVGVAWTIRKGDADRKADLLRIEQERNAEERRFYRPFFNVYRGNNRVDGYFEAYNWLKETENVSKALTEKLNCSFVIHDCTFANTEFSHFYFYGLKANDVMLEMCTKRLVRKNQMFGLNFNFQPLYLEQKIDKLSIIVEDLIGNLYEMNLEFESNDGTVFITGNDFPVRLEKKGE